MAQIKFKNFEAASRKRNMIPFGMFPLGTDLDWIQNASEVSNSTQVASYGTTVTFDYNQANSWSVTLTGDVVTVLITNAGSTTDFTDGNLMILQVIQNSTGGWNFPLPSTVRKYSNYAVSALPSTITTIYLQWRSSAWDIITPPMVGSLT